MLLTFGILALFSGGILLAISSPKLLLSRGSRTTSNATTLFFLGIVLIMLAVLMVHQGQKDADC